MSGETLNSWANAMGLVPLATGGLARTRTIDTLKRTENWSHGIFDFGIAIWRENYLNLAVIAGSWLHDFEVRASRTRSR
jgi:hypothetical protein